MRQGKDGSEEDGGEYGGEGGRVWGKTGEDCGRMR